ncbi:MAG: class I SAM-dependent methyltransferase [Candidatus Nanohaloarchaea archaeon]
MFVDGDALDPTRRGVYFRGTTSVNRYRDYTEEIDERLDGREEVYVLYVGASSGEAVEDLAGNLGDERSYHVEAVEPHPKRARKSGEREGIAVSRATSQMLPYEDDTFDLAVCHRLLPFLDTTDKFASLKEIERVLEPSGTAVLDLNRKEEPDTRIVSVDGFPSLYADAARYDIGES